MWRDEVILDLSGDPHDATGRPVTATGPVAATGRQSWNPTGATATGSFRLASAGRHAAPACKGELESFA